MSGYDPDLPYDDGGPLSDGARALGMYPGSGSALRRATRANPRCLPCPTCHEPHRLTPADRARGYQCDACADRDERGGP